jgi:hypothetical protein
VDDIPLLLGLLMQMGLSELYNRAVGDHGLPTRLSGSWRGTRWLTFILTQGDHMKYKVEEWVARHQVLLQAVTGQRIVAQQFNDNRLSSLLARLSPAARWEGLEAALWQHTLAVYALGAGAVDEMPRAHIDSTTAAGYHVPEPGGVM